MVTDKEMKIIITNAKKMNNVSSYSVTPEEMQRFKKNNELPLLIYNKKIQNDVENGVKATAGYELIEEMCLISVTSLKKTMNGTDRPTRTFLYKFTVGLHMPLDEANKLFDLCGGSLREDDPADYICIHALNDGDSIYDFCKQYEKYIGKKITR